MIYLYDSLVAFVVKVFNKFRVISCLWYERGKTGAKSYYSDFSNVKRSFRLFRKISPGAGSAADDEKMKSVIKMIITVAAYLALNYEIINLTE